MQRASESKQDKSASGQES